MRLKYAKYPRWSDAEHVGIDLIICWDEWDEDLPFTAFATDPEEHGRQIYQLALAGEYGVIAEFVPPAPPATAEVARKVREERDARLAMTDWTQMSDVPEATKRKWSAYRQALRDVPLQPEFPFTVAWPSQSV